MDGVFSKTQKGIEFAVVYKASHGIITETWGKLAEDWSTDVLMNELMNFESVNNTVNL